MTVSDQQAKVLYVLRIALIEIRATDSIDRARVLADIVHSVPSMIGRGAPSDEIMDRVLERAKLHDLEGYFSELFALAQSK